MTAWVLGQSGLFRDLATRLVYETPGGIIEASAPTLEYLATRNLPPGIMGGFLCTSLSRGMN